MKWIKEEDPEVYDVLDGELRREQNSLVLIASENYASPAVLEAQGSVLTNKYAEGYPHQRWYNGCRYVDMAEELAIKRAKELFKAEHVNVQLHSGTQANMAIYYALLDAGDTILAMNVYHGGHLTHGSKANFSGRYYNAISYGVDKETEKVEIKQIEEMAFKHKPKLILVGASAYPRILDFKEWRRVADKVGAYLMADVAHIAGLIAAGLHPDPVPYADVVTTTTHKTLRGPRGAMIMCKARYAEVIDKAVFPGVQAGPLMHVIAAKAVAFSEALKPAFKEYQAQVVKNAKELAKSLLDEGFRLLTGGTDNHLILVDLGKSEISGRDAADVLEEAGIVLNKNVLPFDTRSPAVTSGIRVGTPAVTTRGMKEPEMRLIAKLIRRVLSKPGQETVRREVREEVERLCKKFPIYEGLG